MNKEEQPERKEPSQSKNNKAQSVGSKRSENE